MDDLELFIASGGGAKKDRRQPTPDPLAGYSPAERAAIERGRQATAEGRPFTESVPRQQSGIGTIPAKSVVARDPLEQWLESGGGGQAQRAPSAAPINEAAPSPLGSTAENAAAGAGKAVADLGRGAKQILDIPAQLLEKHFPGVSRWAESHGFPSAAASAAQTEAGIAESRKRDAPLMDTGAGMAGNAAGTLATVMLPGGVASGPLRSALLNPTTYKAAAAVGATQGAFLPVGAGESRLQNAAIGAASGGVANAMANTLGRVAQPVAKAGSQIYQKAVNVLENAGVPLDAAQKSGSAFLNRVRSSFGDNAFTVGPQRAFMGEQQAAYNRAVLKTMGEHADAAIPEVMGRAWTRIDGVFKNVLDRNKVTIDDTTLARIGQVQAAASESEKNQIVSIANRIVNAVDRDGTIKGQVAYGIKKDLDRAANTADSELAHHARDLRGALMDAVNGSLSGADKRAFAEARGQFRNMKQIEGTLDKDGRGDISPAKLSSVMGQKRNRPQSIYGRGPQELVDLAYAGNMLLPDKLPNSGTTARAIMQATLPIAGSIGGAHYGEEKGAGLGAIAGMLAGGMLPRGAQMMMNNPAVSNYMASGMRGSLTPLRDLLMAPNTNPLVGGVVRRIPGSMIPLSAVANESRQ